jgi:hypothetical protein
MFNSVKKLLNGFTSTTSAESEKKEKKMLNFKTNIPAFDEENMSLFRASAILESIGNKPNPTAGEFYNQLLASDLATEDHEAIVLAAVSIETMMSMDMQEYEWEEPTIH